MRYVREEENGNHYQKQSKSIKDQQKPARASRNIDMAAITTTLSAPLQHKKQAPTS
ncbi:hypothetical protein BIFGAL_03642 [Bifidobacterium gallicum DSM 20093 = LMG 11596]|uniref:Uncharacterized protein n=1 Tax=Bifidobacterium gallicum DSM 20093 = LMG 11596 TaxID=561180 RepID=D1NUW5_9BIFI|nr:hypothetical protein BIFGAL_03642 [Bifidobacterium gallicum DSM 20093 = LMG 11596]